MDASVWLAALALALALVAFTASLVGLRRQGARADALAEEMRDAQRRLADEIRAAAAATSAEALDEVRSQTASGLREIESHSAALATRIIDEVAQRHEEWRAETEAEIADVLRNHMVLVRTEVSARSASDGVVRP